MDDFTAFLLFIASIFSFILFVKIWIMTNKVKEMSEDLSELKRLADNPRYIDRANQAYIFGNKEVAKQYLDISLKNVLSYHAESDSKKKPYILYFSKTKKDYSAYYEEFGFEQPDWGKLEDKKNIDILLNQ